MAYETLRKALVARLDEGGRGDRGWWIITRVHLTTARLRDIASFLLDVGATSDRQLTEADYRSMGRLVDVSGKDPGIQLRRHQLLAMEKPLRLIERANGRNWSTIRLTDRGIALATAPDPAIVLEHVISEIGFCIEPFYAKSRVRRYRDYSVAAYPTTLEVLNACDGWLDRDEFDLFLSRIRQASESAWAISGIRAFRALNAGERALLLEEVERRTPGAKRYQNWRDMGLHHFSFFALGTSAIRDGNRLVLSGAFLRGTTLRQRSAHARLVRPRSKTASRPRPLRIPEPKATEELSAPPTTPAANTGTDAEILVGKVLQAAGWSVVYYSAKRGYGFDIWASKGAAAMVVEVKSSVTSLGAIVLTRLEHQAALHHASNFVLAIVEELEDQPRIRFISGPIHRLAIEQRAIEVYQITRDVWEPAAEKSWK